jgi:Ser-tRNA(Ala) deacylase AlaX
LTQRLFRQDPYLLDFDAAVVDRREHEGNLAQGGGDKLDEALRLAAGSVRPPR